MNELIETYVSVIIPTYNRAKLVARAIDSVLAQTYKGYEIIVVDDGSTDNTREFLLQKYSGRVRYIYQNNTGASAARNLGINASQHELIAFLDSDDIWHPRKLELQLPSMLDPHVVLSFTKTAFSKNETYNDDFFGKKELNRTTITKVLEQPLHYLACAPALETPVPSSWICNKKALRKIGNFDERLRIAEDTSVLFKLAMEGSFTVVSVPLYIRSTNCNDHLTNWHSTEFHKEHANNAVGIFLDIYSKASNYPSETQRELRKLISYFLVERSVLASWDRDYTLARRKAFESLAYSPKRKVAIKALIGLFSPRVLRLLRRP